MASPTWISPGAFARRSVDLPGALVSRCYPARAPRLRVPAAWLPGPSGCRLVRLPLAGCAAPPGLWRCKLHQMRRSWQAIAAAESAAKAKWRRGLAAVDDGSTQTEGRAGHLVITQDAWTQAGAALHSSANSSGIPIEYGPRRKRARAAAVDPAEDIAAQNAWMAGAAGSTPTAAEVAAVFLYFLALPCSPPDREQRLVHRDLAAYRAGVAVVSG